MLIGAAARWLRALAVRGPRTDLLFADDAIARCTKASLGLPRALNSAAIAALIAAASAGKALRDDDCAKNRKSRRRTHTRLNGQPVLA